MSIAIAAPTVLRCPYCGFILAELFGFEVGSIRIQCPNRRCRAMHTFGLPGPVQA